MNEFDKDINAEDQFIEADMRADVADDPGFCSIVVQEFKDTLGNCNVSIHMEDDMGGVNPVGLYAPFNSSGIKDAMNECLKSHPDAWINWEHPSFEGVTFQIRRQDGSCERFFRTQTKGVFARRKIYQKRNPGSVVSFTMFPVEEQS